MRLFSRTMLFLLLFEIPAVSAQVQPTNEWVSLWGDSTLVNDYRLPAGSVIEAFDPQGVLCGAFIVASDGDYGLMPVYADDPGTPGIDEGAASGDILTITINGAPAELLGPDTPVWSSNGDVLKVNLRLRVPDIVAIPDVIDLGEIAPGDSAEAVIQLKNVGYADLHIDSLVTVYLFAEDFAVTPGSITIVPGDSTSLFIKFIPSLGAGNVHVEIMIYSDAFNNPGLGIPVTATLPSDIVATNEWVSFWSNQSTLEDSPLLPGYVIDAYDPDGVHCGTFIVGAEGSYGLLPVYRDDATTPAVDEGAQPGDTLRFTINGFPTDLGGPGAPVWSQHGDVIELNLFGYKEVGVSPETVLPEEINLFQNYPNPFNPETNIRFSLPFAGDVSLVIYDVNGREVMSLDYGAVPAGMYTAVWSGTNSAGVPVSSGLYFYRLKVGGGNEAHILTRKMLLLK